MKEALSSLSSLWKQVGGNSTNFESLPSGVSWQAACTLMHFSASSKNSWLVTGSFFFSELLGHVASQAADQHPHGDPALETTPTEHLLQD